MLTHFFRIDDDPIEKRRGIWSTALLSSLKYFGKLRTSCRVNFENGEVKGIKIK